MSFCFAHLHLTSNQRGKGPITTSTLANPVNDGILNFCFTLTRELRWLRARSCTHTYRRSAAAHRRRAVVAGSHSACNLSQRPSFRPCLPPSLPSSLPLFLPCRLSLPSLLHPRLSTDLVPTTTDAAAGLTEAAPRPPSSPLEKAYTGRGGSGGRKGEVGS